MHTLAIFLMIAAAVLLTAEVFIPNFGICGVLGIASFIGAVVITIVYVPYSLFFVLCEIAAVGLLVFFAYRMFKKRFQSGCMVLKDTLDISKPDFDPNEFLGKEGVATTPLKPSGFVDFNGTLLEASSEGVFIDARSRVKVVDSVNNRLIVRVVKAGNYN